MSGTRYMGGYTFVLTLSKERNAIFARARLAGYSTHLALWLAANKSLAGITVERWLSLPRDDVERVNSAPHHYPLPGKLMKRLK